MDMAGNDPEYLTTHEVAALFRVSQDTVTKWARRWEMEKTVKIVRTPGGHMRFRHDDIRKIQGQRDRK